MKQTTSRGSFVKESPFKSNYNVNIWSIEVICSQFRFLFTLAELGLVMKSIICENQGCQDLNIHCLCKKKKEKMLRTLIESSSTLFLLTVL